MSYELSHSLQQSFLIYDEEKMISKVYGQFYLKQKTGYFATSTNSTWPQWEKSILALEGCLHIINSQQRKIRDRPLFEEIFLVSCKQFLLSIFS
jgi:hypothetical protein